MLIVNLYNFVYISLQDHNKDMQLATLNGQRIIMIPGHKFHPTGNFSPISESIVKKDIAVKSKW